MKKNQDIPSHKYHEAASNVKCAKGKPLLFLDPEFPFSLTRFELMKGKAQADYPHRHDYYEVLYLCEGEGIHVVDFEPYEVVPDSFHFISKGQVHFWQLTAPLKGHALLFSDEFLGFPSSDIIRAHDFSFFHHVGEAPCLSVDQEQRARLTGLIDGLEHEFHEGPRSVTVLRSYLHILLTQLHRLYTVDHPDEYSVAQPSLVRQFNRLASEHYLTDNSVQDYANRIGVSASHLRDSVKAVTGYSPGQIIRQHLVLEAKRLLAHSSLTVAEIGYQLNFEDSSYFGRFFKRETDTSPAAFRQQVRERYQIGTE